MPQTPATHGLLTPTLGAEVPTRRLWSTRAMFVVAFFGGVGPMLCLGAMNLRRAGMRPSDRVLLAALAFATIAFAGWMGWRTPAGSLDWHRFAGDQVHMHRYVGRAAGLVMFAAFYARLRPWLRAMEMTGTPPESPWRAGLLAMAIGSAIAMSCAALGSFLANVR